MSRLTYGVGFNSQRQHPTSKGGSTTRAYRTWRCMLQRCYDPKYQESKPTYVGCSVAEEWHDYQNFADWFYSNEYSDRGYELDKDLLISGSKEYSPETCCFVPREINCLLHGNKTFRGKYPQGTHWHKASGRFACQIGINGKLKHLGLFDCPNEAHEFYRKEKEIHIKNVADLWFGSIDNRIYEILMDWELPRE